MKLTLVRHGESIWNATGTWQGQSDVPLSARGRLEARAVADRLFDARFDHRVASDLSRAWETAQAIGGALVAEPRLREIDVGAWAGMQRDEVAERFPDEVRALRTGEPVRIGGGESVDGFEARIDAVVDELASSHGGRDVLAVTHGGVVRALTMRVLGVRGRMSPLVGVANTSLTEVRFESAPRLAVYNDAAHLEPADPEPAITPEATARVALVAADPRAPADRALADRILSRLGIARFGAAGEAANASLSTDLVAEPLGADANRALEVLRAEQDGGAFALVLTPDEVVTTVCSLLALTGPSAFVPPAHGAVTQLRVSRRGALLHSYAVAL